MQEAFFWLISLRPPSSLSLSFITILTAHFVPAVILCLLLPYFPAKLSKIGLLSLAITVQQLEFTGGFYYSHSDLAGQFAGVIFGMTNTMAQVSGVMGPLAIAYLAPNVRSLHKTN